MILMTLCILILSGICHVYLTEIFEYTCFTFGYNIRRKTAKVYHLQNLPFQMLVLKVVK